MTDQFIPCSFERRRMSKLVGEGSHLRSPINAYFNGVFRAQHFTASFLGSDVAGARDLSKVADKQDRRRKGQENVQNRKGQQPGGCAWNATEDFGFLID